MAKVVQPVTADPSLAALVTPFPSVPEGKGRDPPSGRLPGVLANKVAAAVMRLPPTRTHVSALLPGTKVAQTLHPSEQPQPTREEASFVSMVRHPQQMSSH